MKKLVVNTLKSKTEHKKHSIGLQLSKKKRNPIFYQQHEIGKLHTRWQLNRPYTVLMNRQHKFNKTSEGTMSFGL